MPIIHDPFGKPHKYMIFFNQAMCPVFNAEGEEVGQTNKFWNYCGSDDVDEAMDMCEKKRDAYGEVFHFGFEMPDDKCRI